MTIRSPINHHDVQSTSIRSIGHDSENNELHVTFHDTGRYIYSGVPKEVHEALMMSGSKGSFIHNNIKGRYPYKKL